MSMKINLIIPVVPYMVAHKTNGNVTITPTVTVSSSHPSRHRLSTSLALAHVLDRLRERGEMQMV